MSFVMADTLHYSFIYPYCVWNMTGFKIGCQLYSKTILVVCNKFNMLLKNVSFKDILLFFS